MRSWRNGKKNRSQKPRAAARARLLARQRRLLAGFNALQEDTRCRAADVSDIADTACVSVARDVALRVAEIRSGEVAEIEVAFQKLSDGSYGICEWCHKRISGARLRIMPTSLLCVRCQRDCESGTGRGTERKNI